MDAKRAFMLIELLVVIAIIAILAALLLPLRDKRLGCVRQPRRRLDSLVGNLASPGLPVSLPLPIVRDTASGLVQPVDVLRTMLDFDACQEFRGVGCGLA